jgi:hypothetical protein
MSETSHGKARPSLPRSNELAAVQSERDPLEGRDATGRFAPGNPISQGQRWKASIKKLLGRGATNEQAQSVAREAFRLYLAVMRELPSDGATARMLAALQARHAALAAHYTNQAAEAGLDTEAGKELLELASKHGQRAERLAVTCLDVATKHAIAKKHKPGNVHRNVLDAFGTPRPVKPVERSAPATQRDESEPASAATGQPGAADGVPA